MHVIDSHTGGMPTRVILSGGPDLGDGPITDRARRLAQDHPEFCRSVLAQPRGQDGMVGALLVTPADKTCAYGVIFFDAQAVLGMCGHGTIGMAVTMASLDRLNTGEHKIETPVGVVRITLHDANTVTVTNVESRRVAQGKRVEVEGLGTITGDVAFGGNWFFIVEPSPITVCADNIRDLTDVAVAVRSAALAAGLGGENGEPIDHVIFQDPGDTADVHSCNFVLCPDDTYDRSPCGTGSSARLACLAADKRLAPKTEIIQKSVIGSPYKLSYENGAKGGVIPHITGSAFVMADSTLVFSEKDSFSQGCTP
ncbi:4-hydroxyproline epimerase [Shimia sp. SK013]|uniref:4-hydroxyproline epimerase n=1 Tax=Shimia sp. SK013 TaxID=1389006 RepID=UPI0006B40954|nr:proline racemase family protein [Shimia sp. SK013]KPA20761.1 4-hydroxyproline epimerase [Shimia sp. SK013]